MAETKWENTPWHYQEESDAYTHIVRGSNNEYIGAAAQGSLGQSESAARLWAAAPDLYAALAALVQDAPEEDCGDPACVDCNVYRPARAALKKAATGITARMSVLNGMEG